MKQITIDRKKLEHLQILAGDSRNDSNSAGYTCRLIYNEIERILYPKLKNRNESKNGKEVS